MSIAQSGSSSIWEIPRVELECVGVSKRYTDGDSTISAIENFSASFTPGSLVAITGPSGAGKSTLLAMLAALEHPDEGSILFRANDELHDLETFGSDEQVAYRGRWVSFLYPEENLLPMLSIYENIALSLSVKNMPEPEIDARIKRSLADLEIPDLAHRQPTKLSTGERSRAALARAIAGGNPVVLVDEPTAHLDQERASVVADLLHDLAGPRIVIVATHDPIVMERADHSISLRRNA